MIRALFRRYSTIPKTLQAVEKSVVAVNCNVHNSNFLELGTGFILGDEGYVLTCGHVVENACKVEVVTCNTTYEDVKIVFCHPHHDVALLKLNATENFLSLNLRAARHLSIGERVFSMGFPVGGLRDIDVSCMPGHVIGIGEGSSKRIEVLKTTCRTNVGNSGGPVFDVNGRLVAMTAGEHYKTDVNRQFLHVSIPIENVLHVMTRLIDNDSANAIRKKYKTCFDSLLEDPGNITEQGSSRMD